MGVMTNGDALYSHAFDDEGRDLGPSTILLYSPSRVGQGTHAISFDNWTNGTISRLELFISRPKTFEFFINPADVKTNGPSK